MKLKIFRLEILPQEDGGKTPVDLLLWNLVSTYATEKLKKKISASSKLLAACWIDSDGVPIEVMSVSGNLR